MEKEEMLSFTLKGRSGVEGNMCIRLPPKPQEPDVVPTTLKGCLRFLFFDFIVCIVPILATVVVVGIPLVVKGGTTVLQRISAEKVTVDVTGKVIFEFPDTRYILIGCVAVLATFVLLFGIYCWYRVRMVAQITDERKLGYGVLKELVEKLPEIR